MTLLIVLYVALYLFVTVGMIYEAVTERGFPRYFFKYFALLSVGAFLAFIYV